MNRGQVVKIRLRSACDSSLFLPYVDVLGTLIHELTHNLVSNHASKFYKVMDELYEEVEKDEDKSFGNTNTTVPIQGTGTRLGSRSTSISSGKNLRTMAAEAALRRQKDIGSASVRGLDGGYILGGKPLLENTRAEQRSRILDALERRRVDNQTCPAEHKQAVPSSIVNGSLWECPDCSWFYLPSDNMCSVCHFSQDIAISSSKKIGTIVVDLTIEGEQVEEDVIFLE